MSTQIVTHAVPADYLRDSVDPSKNLTLRKDTTVPLTNSQMDTNFTLLRAAAWDAYDIAEQSFNLAADLEDKLADDGTLMGDINTIKTRLNSLKTTTGQNTELGFVPVRQGGGVGQTDTQVNIGTNNTTSSRRLQVQTGSGSTMITHDKWPIDIDGTSTGAPWTGITGVTQSHNAYGVRTISTSGPAASQGADGDIWYQY